MTSNSWDLRFAEYKHIKENGSALGNVLSTWASRQRTASTSGTLSDERRKKLDGIGFEWNTKACTWDHNFTILETYHRSRGNCRGPFHDRKYYLWVMHQRYSLGDKESLNEIQKERWARLNTLGFWGATEQGEPPGHSAEARAPRATAASWDRRFAEYKHNKENGLPNGTYGGLNAWISLQRKSHANGTLSRECKEKLDSVGFVWKASFRHDNYYKCDAWNNRFIRLETHRHEKGHCRGPYPDKQFEQWVINQRSTLKDKESLCEVQQERWARLNTLGFWSATKQRREPEESGLDAVVLASHANASEKSNSDSELGQDRQHSGVVRITVSGIARFAEAITRSHDQTLHCFHVACISKPTKGGHNGNQVLTLMGYLCRVSVFVFAFLRCSLFSLF
jgi:Helicase associated domain